MSGHGWSWGHTQPPGSRAFILSFSPGNIKERSVWVSRKQWHFACPLLFCVELYSDPCSPVPTAPVLSGLWGSALAPQPSFSSPWPCWLKLPEEERVKPVGFHIHKSPGCSFVWGVWLCFYCCFESSVKIVPLSVPFYFPEGEKVLSISVTFWRWVKRVCGKHFKFLYSNWSQQVSLPWL